MAGPDPIGVSLVGQKELQRKLLAMNNDMRTKTIKNANNRAAKIVASWVQRLAPDKTTAPVHIADNIKVTHAKLESDMYNAKHYVLIKKAWYWFIVEHGRSGAPAYPFVQPAFKLSADIAIEEIFKTVKRAIRKHMKMKGLR